MDNFTIYEDFGVGGGYTGKYDDGVRDDQEDGYYYDGRTSSTSLEDTSPMLSSASQSRTLYDYDLPLVFEPLVRIHFYIFLRDKMMIK